MMLMGLRIQRCSKLILILTVLLYFPNCRTNSNEKLKNRDSTNVTTPNKLDHLIDTFSINEGQKLFGFNCKQCHSIRKTDNFLQGVTQRLDENYFRLYVTKQDSLIKAKDKYALELKGVSGNMPNSHNYHLSSEQTGFIFAYLNKYSR